MLPLALPVSEIFNPSADQLELDLGVSAGKAWTTVQCPPGFLKF